MSTFVSELACSAGGGPKIKKFIDGKNSSSNQATTKENSLGGSGSKAVGSQGVNSESKIGDKVEEPKDEKISVNQNIESKQKNSSVKPEGKGPGDNTGKKEIKNESSKEETANLKSVKESSHSEPKAKENLDDYLKKIEEQTNDLKKNKTEEIAEEDSNIYEADSIYGTEALRDLVCVFLRNILYKYSMSKKLGLLTLGFLRCFERGPISLGKLLVRVVALKGFLDSIGKDDCDGTELCYGKEKPFADRKGNNSYYITQSDLTVDERDADQTIRENILGDFNKMFGKFVEKFKTLKIKLEKRYPVYNYEKNTSVIEQNLKYHLVMYELCEREYLSALFKDLEKNNWIHAENLIFDCEKYGGYLEPELENFLTKFMPGELWEIMTCFLKYKLANPEKHFCGDVDISEFSDYALLGCINDLNGEDRDNLFYDGKIMMEGKNEFVPKNPERDNLEAIGTGRNALDYLLHCNMAIRRIFFRSFEHDMLLHTNNFNEESWFTRKAIVWKNLVAIRGFVRLVNFLVNSSNPNMYVELLRAESGVKERLTRYEQWIKDKKNIKDFLTFYLPRRHQADSTLKNTTFVEQSTKSGKLLGLEFMRFLKLAYYCYFSQKKAFAIWNSFKDISGAYFSETKSGSPFSFIPSYNSAEEIDPSHIMDFLNMDDNAPSVDYPGCDAEACNEVIALYRDFSTWLNGHRGRVQWQFGGIEKLCKLPGWWNENCSENQNSRDQMKSNNKNALRVMKDLASFLGFWLPRRYYLDFEFGKSVDSPVMPFLRLAYHCYFNKSKVDDVDKRTILVSKSELSGMPYKDSNKPLALSNISYNDITDIWLKDIIRKLIPEIKYLTERSWYSEIYYALSLWWEKNEKKMYNEYGFNSKYEDKSRVMDIISEFLNIWLSRSKYFNSLLIKDAWLRSQNPLIAFLRLAYYCYFNLKSAKEIPDVQKNLIKGSFARNCLQKTVKDNIVYIIERRKIEEFDNLMSLLFPKETRGYEYGYYWYSEIYAYFVWWWETNKDKIVDRFGKGYGEVFQDSVNLITESNK